jgi:FkbM family methyltransferase
MKVKSLLVRVQNVLTLWIVTVLHLKKNQDLKLERLGTSYGGWFVPKNALSDNSRIKYLISVGIGHDVSFDLAMQKFGFNIIAIDPLKECCEFARNQLVNTAGLTVINSGLWKEKGEVLFFPPNSQNSNSWSITNEHRTPTNLSQSFPTITLSEIFQMKSDISSACVVLKIDIEGAERFIFEDIVNHSEHLEFICIELDFLQILPFLALRERIYRVFEARRILRDLSLKGLDLVHYEGFNLFWANKNRKSKDSPDRTVRR